MIATPQELRALSFDLTTSVWTLAAIGALFEAGAAPLLREPRSLDELAAGCPGLGRARLERTLAVAATAGVVIVEGGRYRLADGAIPFTQDPMQAGLRGDIRTQLMQALAFLDGAGGASPRSGWYHTDAAVLQAQGDASAALPGMLKAMILPTLGDLAARLERPGARFLDVGVGVGSLAIAMCRAFSAIEVVGLDIRDAPLALARANVARAGLAARIDLRKLGSEDLADEAAFDLAWLPAFFLDAAIVPRAAARVHAALKPGGWLVLPLLATGAEGRAGAVAALVNETWGGPAFSPPEAETLLRDAGFAVVRSLGGPVWAPTMTVAQRAG